MLQRYLTSPHVTFPVRREPGHKRRQDGELRPHRLLPPGVRAILPFRPAAHSFMHHVPGSRVLMSLCVTALFHRVVLVRDGFHFPACDFSRSA